jgi:hypothetical protein
MTEANEQAADVERWSRKGTVTASRAVIVGAILAVLGMVAVFSDSLFLNGVDDGWEGLVAIVGTMVMLAAGFGFAGLIYWWVDHLVARRGRLASAAVHTAIGFGIALVVVLPEGSGFESVGEKVTGLLLIPGAVLAATSVAGFVRGSFDPGRGAAG